MIFGPSAGVKLCVTGTWKPSMCVACELAEIMDAKVRVKGAFLAWIIWGERTQKVFSNKTTPTWLHMFLQNVFLDWLRTMTTNIALAIINTPICH